MFAALCCVATMIVQIPTVAGYTNLGECMCLLAGLVLGPWYGFFAAGIGSGLADLLAGYAHYVPRAVRERISASTTRSTRSTKVATMNFFIRPAPRRIPSAISFMEMTM